MYGVKRGRIFHIGYRSEVLLVSIAVYLVALLVAWRVYCFAAARCNSVQRRLRFRGDIGEETARSNSAENRTGFPIASQVQ